MNSPRDRAVTALLLPQLAMQLQNQAEQLEHAMGALRAVGELARCAAQGRGGAFTACDELQAANLGHLALALAHYVERPLREIDRLANELERATT